MDYELKRCPFCGGNALGPTDAWPHMVTCEDCGASVKGFRFGETGVYEAIDKWNRRAAPVVHSTYHLHHREDFSAPPCECNNCHCEFTVDDVEEDCHYCPKCGARMDGGE